MKDLIRKLPVAAVMMLILFNTGCKKKSIPPVNVIVLCDVSLSLRNKATMDDYQKRIEGMKAQGQDILRSYPPGSKIDFYIISQNSFPEPLLSYVAPKVLKKNAHSVLKNIRSTDTLLCYRLDSAAAKREPYSCVLTSLEHAHARFRTLRQQNKEVRENKLIVLSDMIEDCTQSPVGNIKMYTDSGRTFLTAAQRDTLSRYECAVNFDEMGTEIKVLVNTSYLSSEAKRSLDEVWRNIFSRYHYKRAADPSYVLLQSNAPFEPLPVYKL